MNNMPASRNTTKGAVDVPLMAVIGIVSTVGMAFVGFVMSTTSTLSGNIDGVRDNVALHDTRISVVEVELKRVPYLEAKIDRLLERQGIDPTKVLPAAVISAVPTTTDTKQTQTLIQ